MSTWTTPITWANGAVTAAQMNSLRDNLNWLKGALAEAGIVSDTAPPVQSIIGATIFHSVVIPTGTGAATVMPFDSEVWDAYAMHDQVTNTGRLTIPTTPGVANGDLWEFGSQIQWAGSATGYRQLQLRLNGSTVFAVQSSTPSSTEPHSQQVMSHPIALNIGDYVEAIGQQNSGGNLNIGSGGSLTPFFWARHL